MCVSNTKPVVSLGGQGSHTLHPLPAQGSIESSYCASFLAFATAYPGQGHMMVQVPGSLSPTSSVLNPGFWLLAQPFQAFGIWEENQQLKMNHSLSLSLILSPSLFPDHHPCHTLTFSLFPFLPFTESKHFLKQSGSTWPHPSLWRHPQGVPPRNWGDLQGPQAHPWPTGPVWILLPLSLLLIGTCDHLTSSVS